MRLAFPLLVVLASGLSCRAQEPEQGLELEPLALPVRAWTDRYQADAVLLADEIAIEGPSDLVDHVALRQDPETSNYSSQTIREGLFQELAARPEMGTPVTAQLDSWSLAAVRRITILQRPGDAPVIVRANGNVFWSSGGEERREDALVFEGRHTAVGGGR